MPETPAAKDKTGKNVSTNLGTVTCARRGPDDDKAWPLLRLLFGRCVRGPIILDGVQLDAS